MKRMLLMAVLLALTLFTAQAATAPTPIHECGDYTYIFLTDDDIQIVCWDGDDLKLDVPSKLDGHTVTSISECAFADCGRLEAVTLPDTVREIGDGAFTACVRLSRVALPEGLTDIGSAAFDGCEGLTAIELPASATRLGDNPFRGCANLCHILVSPDNPNLYTEDGVLFSRDDSRLVCFPMGNTSPSYAVPEGVTVIGAAAFDQSLFLESLRLPGSLTTIGRGAFDRCPAFRAADLPAGVSMEG